MVEKARSYVVINKVRPEIPAGPLEYKRRSFLVLFTAWSWCKNPFCTWQEDQSPSYGYSYTEIGKCLLANVLHSILKLVHGAHKSSSKHELEMLLIKLRSVSSNQTSCQNKNSVPKIIRRVIWYLSKLICQDKMQLPYCLETF